MHAPSGYSNPRLGRDLAIKEGIEFLAEDYRKIAAGHCQVNRTKPSFSPKQQGGIAGWGSGDASWRLDLFFGTSR